MKKLFFIITLLVSAHLSAAHVQTVNKSVSDLANQYSWKHDTCYLSFQLDDAITVTGTAGNAKFCDENNVQSMRYYQGCRHGEFAIRAKEGVVIQSIKLTYFQKTSNSVATTVWTNDGKKVAEANQVKSDVDLMVNATSITLYTGRTTNEDNGQIRITSFEVTYVIVHGDCVFSKSTQAMAEQYGWSHEACIRNFNLNENLSVDVDSAGTMKYNMNTKQLHCYQWLGGFTIKAKEGCKIKTVKLTYTSINSGVMTKNWGTDGKNIPEVDRIASNQVVEVNGNAVSFYVGTTDTVSNGQIRITQWEVEYTESYTDNLMFRRVLDLGKQYAWANDSCPVHVPLNNALSLHSDQKNNMKYYSTTRSFHCYQWCKGIYFKARPGAKIKSLVVYYESLNNAVLIQNWGADGKNIPEEDWIASGTTVMVNSDSVHFFVGDKSDTKSCQIHVTGFSIQYTDTLAHTETWTNCSSKGSEEAVAIIGDKGYYQWQANHFQRSNEDYVGVEQGIRILYNGALSTDGVQEGGIKDVSFNWCTTDNTQAVQFNIQAGETTDKVARSNPGSPSYVMNYTKQFNVKANCAFTISMGAQSAPAQTCPIIGSVTITPYLLFKQPNHVDTVDTNKDQYDLLPTLINNSGEEPVFELMENTTGEEITITNGIVNLIGLTNGGYIRVKASCFSGAVFTTLTLYIQMAPRVYFTETNKVVNIADAPFVNPLIAPDHIGVITYSSSDTKVAMVNDTGLITITGLGQAVITAHVAASETFVATSASFNLSVIYTPDEGTYRIETFSQCRKKKATEGFAYVEGDDAVYDWNLSYFSRDKQDRIGEEQGILLYHGGSIATNGVQEGGVQYMAFSWRAIDSISPVHFFVNATNTSVSHSQPAVGDTSMVLTFSHLFNIKSNTSFSINVRTKENPAQSQIVVGPLQIVPYLLFTNKYVELELPQTSYDCAREMINNTDGEGEIVYSIVSSTCDTVAIAGSVLDLSATTQSGDIKVQATWGEVSTTMTVHLTIPSGIDEVHNAQCTMHNGKVMVNGVLRIWHNGAWWSVLGEEMHNEK